jgi:hypothetical protein
MTQDINYNVEELENSLKKIFGAASMFLRTSIEDKDSIINETQKAFLSFKDRLEHEIMIESRKEEPNKEIISLYTKKIDTYSNELELLKNK